MDAGRRVIHEILGQLRGRRWRRRDLFDVHVAMEEALINAVRHGNRLDPAKHLHIGCQLFRDRVRIEISDEGAGFDPAAVPDPTQPSRIGLPRGRGLMLIRAFMSRVEFQDQGRCLVMEKILEGPAGQSRPDDT
jgi:serine/threonine-protein kinase RsbW